MPQNPLFKDPKTRHPIYNLDLPFSDYITQCQQIIAHTRRNLKEDSEKIIMANSPFQLYPRNQKAKAGVLMMHGLLECPFMMKDIGMKLQEQGMLARAILLPGHGTVPGDLLSVDYTDWVQAMRYGIASLKQEVETIYLLGFSTGASLALYHILQHADIAGIVLLSPAIKIRSRLDFSCNWHRLISWGWERAKWLHLAEENDYAKYQSITFNAVWQVYRLSRLIKKFSQTHLASCPQLFVVSMADSTISARATLKYFQTFIRPDNRLIIYSSKNLHQKDPNCIVRSSVYPDLHIRELSHICIPISPENIHYGKQGDYLRASHVEEKSDVIYGAFNKLEDKIYHFLYQNHFIKLERKRLSFNPDFDFLVNEIKNFLSTSHIMSESLSTPG